MPSTVHFLQSLVRGVGLGVVLTSLLATTGCGDDVTDHLVCSAASECAISTDLSGGQPATECCAGFCVIPSPGCDTGYRYVRSDRDVGECVATATCPPVQPEADMSVEADLSEPIVPPPGDGGDNPDGA